MCVCQCSDDEFTSVGDMNPENVCTIVTCMYVLFYLFVFCKYLKCNLCLAPRLQHLSTVSNSK